MRYFSRSLNLPHEKNRPHTEIDNVVASFEQLGSTFGFLTVSFTKQSNVRFILLFSKYGKPTSNHEGESIHNPLSSVLDLEPSWRLARIQ